MNRPAYTFKDFCVNINISGSNNITKKADKQRGVATLSKSKSIVKSKIVQTNYVTAIRLNQKQSHSTATHSWYSQVSKISFFYTISGYKLPISMKRTTTGFEFLH